MLEIYLNRIKNCISELESTKKEIEKVRNELECVYRNFDSLVDGKIDKRALRVIIEEVSGEAESVSDLKDVLEQVLRQYERTEQKITRSKNLSKGVKDFSYVPLHIVGNKLELMGITFE